MAPRCPRGLFTVQALRPGRLFPAQWPTSCSTAQATPACATLQRGSWPPPASSAGSFLAVELAAKLAVPWGLGDRGLLIHLFRGIGGRQGQAHRFFSPLTGHFAFGEAEVVRDLHRQSFSSPCVSHQIYANIRWIVAGNAGKWKRPMPATCARGWPGHTAPSLICWSS